MAPACLAEALVIPTRGWRPHEPMPGPGLPAGLAAVRRFGDATGVPVLLNTSFNLRGEPMVATPADALKTFKNSGIDLLVMGRFVIPK